MRHRSTSVGAFATGVVWGWVTGKQRPVRGPDVVVVRPVSSKGPGTYTLLIQIRSLPNLRHVEAASRKESTVERCTLFDNLSAVLESRRTGICGDCCGFRVDAWYLLMSELYFWSELYNERGILSISWFELVYMNVTSTAKDKV